MDEDGRVDCQEWSGVECIVADCARERRRLSNRHSQIRARSQDPPAHSGLSTLILASLALYDKQT
jgi:hypothetical protein